MSHANFTIGASLHQLAFGNNKHNSQAISTGESTTSGVRSAAGWQFPCPQPAEKIAAHFSKLKIRFQSFFMLMAFQPLLLASSYNAGFFVVNLAVASRSPAITESAFRRGGPLSQRISTTKGNVARNDPSTFCKEPKQRQIPSAFGVRFNTAHGAAAYSML